MTARLRLPLEISISVGFASKSTSDVETRMYDDAIMSLIARRTQVTSSVGIFETFNSCHCAPSVWFERRFNHLFCNMFLYLTFVMLRPIHVLKFLCSLAAIAFCTDAWEIVAFLYGPRSKKCLVHWLMTVTSTNVQSHVWHNRIDSPNVANRGCFISVFVRN